MKIIGETGDGFILMASKDEVANLLGFYWTGVSGMQPLRVGIEVKVSAVFLVGYERERRRKELNEAIKSLQTVASYLEPVVPVAFPEPTEKG